MKGMKDEKSKESEGGNTENGVAFLDLLFIITILLDLSTLNLRPVHSRAVVHYCSGVWAKKCLLD